MTSPPDPLGAVRAALLARARAEAGCAATQAGADAEAAVRTATEEGERLLARAREDGAAEAEAVLATRRARVRGDVRAEVLQAQQQAYDELLRAARGRARAVLASHPDLPARLGELARRRLGDAARVSHADGGVVGELDRLRWVWSSDQLAEQAVQALGRDVERLWTS